MARSITQVIDNVGAAIDSVIQPYIVDVTFDAFPTLAIMEDRGKVTMPDPSYDISWPIVTGKLRSGTYAGAFRFPGIEQQVFDRAILPWKQAFADVVVSGADVMKARGPYAAFQLTDGLKQVTKMTIADLMGEQIYGDGIGTTLDGAPVGFDDGDLFASYAGIPRSSLDGWKGFVDGSGGTITLPLLTNAIGKTRIGQDQVDLITMPQDLWDAVQNRAQTQQQFDRNDDRNNTANLGFTVIRHLGADIVDEPKVAAGNVFGWNIEYSELAVMEDRVWAWTGWEKIPGSDAFEAQYLFMGNFCFKAPRMFWRLFNITP